MYKLHVHFCICFLKIICVIHHKTVDISEKTGYNVNILCMETFLYFLYSPFSPKNLFHNKLY